MTSAEDGVLALAIAAGLVMLVGICASCEKEGKTPVLPPDRSCIVCWDGQEAQTVELPGAFPLNVEFQLAPTGGYVRVSYTDKESR